MDTAITTFENAIKIVSYSPIISSMQRLFNIVLLQQLAIVSIRTIFYDCKKKENDSPRQSIFSTPFFQTVVSF